jgi:hypothetical protein
MSVWFLGFRRSGAVLAVVGALFLAWPSVGRGQGTGGPTISESSVGYIDPAPPGNVLRQRYDTAYNFRRPTRAEFFYAQTQPGGPGLPRPEPSVDYQELTTYLEVAPLERFSVFVEVPERFLNPEVNLNTAGLGDMYAGFKYALLSQEDLVTTFQLKAYAPTGDADRGLGNHHATLEPGLLLFSRLEERLALSGELRLWVPIGGTDFAGNILRYGLGLQYDLIRTESLRFTPVAEFVGWTVFNGKESVVHPGGIPEVLDASGDTILNAKLGFRVRFGDLGDLYGGYGRPLTGDRWYENIYRVEFRLFF